MNDFLGGCRGPFDFESLENKLKDIKSGMDATVSVPVQTTKCIELGDRQVIGILELRYEAVFGLTCLLLKFSSISHNLFFSAFLCATRV